MPIYVYETIPADCCADPQHYEIEQAAEAAPLEKHPETGEPIKRTLLAGREVVRDAATDGECCSGSSCC